MIRSIAALSLVCGLAFSASAQVSVSVRPLVMAGDVYGAGNIATGFSSSENLAINNSGTWLIEARTSAPLVIRGTGAAIPGTVYMAAGDPVAAPAGATISSFDAITLNNSGNSAFNIFYAGATTATDSGVHYNLTQLVPEGSLAPATGFSPNTPYIGWFEALINDDNQVLMLASVDDPAITSTVDRGLVLIDDPAGAATQTVLLKEGDTVVAGRLLVDVTTSSPRNIAMANGPRVLTIPDLDGATTDDSGVLRYESGAWSFVAREGDPVAAVSGRNWASLSSAGVDINNNGDWVVAGTLNAPTTDDSIIVKNGTQVIAQEGSGHPSIGAFTFTTFGTGNVRIDDAGHVYYYGDWNDTDTTRDTGLFRDGQLIVQKGVTTVPSGEVVTDISAVQDNMAVSRNGRYLLVEATLTDTLGPTSRRGTLLVELGCPADFNHSGAVTVQDIFDFLAAYFANDSAADFNGVGGITVQDIFDFLAAYFTPCA